MNEVRQCPVCEGDALTRLHTSILNELDYREPERRVRKSNNYHRNFVLFEYVLGRSPPAFKADFLICHKCGFICFTPRPTEADLDLKYRLVRKQGDTVERERIRRLVDQRPARGRAIARLLSGYVRSRTGRAVDVGGTDGHCLAGFVEEFQCEILDFETRELWPGVQRIGNTFADLGTTDLFDLCITCHTLEHIPAVREFIDRVHDHLVEGGTLYVEVPLGCAGEIYRTRNFLTHVNFFSEGSLGFLLEQAGLHVEYMTTKPTLSMNKYLPVISAIARKVSSKPPLGYHIRNASVLTHAQMKSNLSKRVAVANARLVAANPLQYLGAFLRRVLRRAGGAVTGPSSVSESPPQ